jgi:hypothetical protein
MVTVLLHCKKCDILSARACFVGNSARLSGGLALRDGRFAVRALSIIASAAKQSMAPQVERWIASLRSQ